MEIGKEERGAQSKRKRQEEPANSSPPMRCYCDLIAQQERGKWLCPINKCLYEVDDVMQSWNAQECLNAQYFRLSMREEQERDPGTLKKIEHGMNVIRERVKALPDRRTLWPGLKPLDGDDVGNVIETVKVPNDFKWTLFPGGTPAQGPEPGDHPFMDRVLFPKATDDTSEDEDDSDAEGSDAEEHRMERIMERQGHVVRVVIVRGPPCCVGELSTFDGPVTVRSAIALVMRKAIGQKSSMVAMIDSVLLTKSWVESELVSSVVFMFGS